MRAEHPGAALPRRELVRGGLFAALAAAGLLPGTASAAPVGSDEQAFAATLFDDALMALGGAPAVCPQIVLDAPDAAENGALVPITLSCSLPGTQEMFIVVDSNPQPLALRFTIPEGTEPFIATRIKMASSGDIYAVVRAEGRLYAARQHTDITVGGCG